MRSLVLGWMAAAIAAWLLLCVCPADAELMVTTSSGIYRYSDSGDFLGLKTLNHYTGITTAADGGLFTAFPASSSTNVRIDHYTANLQSVNSFGKDAGMLAPGDLTLGSDGSLYPTSSSPSFSGKITRFDPNTGTYLG